MLKLFDYFPNRTLSGDFSKTPMLISSWTGAWQIYRNKQPSKFMAKLLVAMSFSGCFATLAGWYATEIGRQPWLVHGVLTTSEARAETIDSSMILTTLIMYLSIYSFLIVSFVFLVFYLAKKAGLKD